MRYQNVPDAATYDEYGFNLNLSTQQVLLASPQAGTYYIMLQGDQASAGGQPFTLTAQELTFGVLGVSPSRGGNIGETTVTIQGAGSVAKHRGKPRGLERHAVPGGGHVFSEQHHVVRNV